MEEITHELVRKKRSVENINSTALKIKRQMKCLHENLKMLEQQHISECGNISEMEDNYEKSKKQLLMVEKTLKTLAQSKERVKCMIENIAPSIQLGDLSD